MCYFVSMLSKLTLRKRKDVCDNFSFYENEYRIRRIVNRKIKDKGRDGAKKKRELFHLLVFRELSDKYFRCRYRNREAPDAEIVYRRHKIGVEITEVFDNSDSYNGFRSNLNSFLSGNAVGKFIQSDPREASVKMEEIFRQKTEKLRSFYTSEYEKTILLIVTSECAKNPEHLIKHWYERYCCVDRLREMNGIFFEVYFLNYGASGKDSGPVLIDLDSAIMSATLK